MNLIIYLSEFNILLAIELISIRECVFICHIWEVEFRQYGLGLRGLRSCCQHLSHILQPCPAQFEGT